MKFLFPLFLSIFFLSCQKKDIKIPVNDNPGIHEIWNNSHVFILMKVQNGDTIPDVKLGQIISTTDWLVAIDRRLKMKKLLPALQKVLKARHKKSIHKTGKEKAYLTYLDTTANKISFVRFDSIQIMPNIYNSQSYFKKYYKQDSAYKKIHIFIQPNSVYINDSLVFKEPLNKKNIQKKLSKYYLANEDSLKIYLNFDQNIYYDRFLNYYTFFKNLKKPGLDSKIFIFEP